ncbi:hypothetical protein [Paenibacillus sp. y28]|uniref:hypothetical protein n=1 Tax=Paenibacillus sp. y28 TaxID=3129110 RepID=UPI00301884F4
MIKSFVQMSKDAISKVNKKAYMMSITGAAALMSAIPASAAPNTGDADIDEVLTAIDVWWAILKAGFKYLALAAIVITGFVIAFFWLRGKLKQAVSGA